MVQANHKARQTPRRRHWSLVAALVLTCTAWSVAPALAVDKGKVAEAMAVQAGKAFESGDYPRAADLYLSAYRTEANSAFLYGASRSQHLAGRIDQATELYQQFLKAPNADPERMKRAREYLADIERAKAVALAADADKAQRDDPKLASSLFLDAFKLTPARLDWLFRAAVAEQQAGDLSGAQQHFEAYLGQASPSAPERSQAQARLESIRRKLNPQVAPEPEPRPEPKPVPKPEPAPEPKVVPVIAPKPVVTPEPPTVTPPAAGLRKTAPEPVNWPGWTLVGVGGAAAVTGIVLYALASSDLSQFQTDLAVTNSSGLISGLTHEEAATRASSINARMGVAAGLAGAGLAAAGVGTWLLVRTPARDVHVVPQVGGATLVWRF